MAKTVTTPTPPPTREPTGVPNLDLVLDGGLSRGALVIIVGPPGSGKTTLANQMAFAATSKSQSTIVFSALSEPTSKLIEHLRTYQFFKGELVGDAIQFLSLEQFISADLEEASQAIISSARQAKAHFVVLDGFRGMRGANVDPQVARQFLYDVGTSLSLFGTTTVITSEVEPRDPNFFPETTTADVIIGLHYDLVGIRQQRGIEAVKVRGASPLSGLHGLELDHSGLIVYPRLETQAIPPTQQFMEYGAGSANTTPIVAAPPVEGVPFDLPELDAMLHGGISRGSNSLVVGPLNTGKTLLGLRFALVGAEAGEPTLFLGFRETLEQLQQKTDGFAQFAGLNAALGPTGNLVLQRWEPIELSPDRVIHHLMLALDRIHARRLVVDSLAEIRRAVRESSGAARQANYFAALQAALRTRGITSIFILETPLDLVELTDDFAAMQTDTILRLHHTTEDMLFQRRIQVVKTRFTSAEVQERSITISAPEGIRVRSVEG